MADVIRTRRLSESWKQYKNSRAASMYYNKACGQYVEILGAENVKLNAEYICNAVGLRNFRPAQLQEKQLAHYLDEL